MLGWPGMPPAAWNVMIDSNGSTGMIIVEPETPPEIAPTRPSRSDPMTASVTLMAAGRGSQ